VRHEALFRVTPSSDVSAIHTVPDGIFLVRVDRAQYRWHKQKPYYEIRFAVLKPTSDRVLHYRPPVLHTQAMWKLSWFLRDFGYDAELLGKNESTRRPARSVGRWSRSAKPPCTHFGFRTSTALPQLVGERALRLYRQRSAWVGVSS